MNYLSTIPAILVIFLMVCRINEKKWGVTSPQGWAYILFTAGAALSVLFTFQTGMAVPKANLVMDVAVFLYFGKRSSIRYLNCLKRRNKDARNDSQPDH